MKISRKLNRYDVVSQDRMKDSYPSNLLREKTTSSLKCRHCRWTRSHYFDDEHDMSTTDIPDTPRLSLTSDLKNFLIQTSRIIIWITLNLKYLIAILDVSKSKRLNQMRWYIQLFRTSSTFPRQRYNDIRHSNLRNATTMKVTKKIETRRILCGISANAARQRTRNKITIGCDSER